MLKVHPLCSVAFAAVAALATTCNVHAQSSVTAYGLIDLSIGRTQNPGGVATKGIDSGKMTTSYIGFRGSEDLGGGLKGVFSIESFMRNDTGSAGRFDADTFWARNSFVGVEGGFGTVTLGRNTTSLFVQTLLFNPFGDSFGFSPSIRHYFTSGTTTGDTGWSDSLKYTSPRFGGFSFSAHAAAAEGNGGRNVGASLGYGGGPIAAGLAWQKVEKGATVQDTTTWQLAASYDFKVAKLFMQYGNVDNDTTGRDFKILGVGVSVPVGAGRLLAQHGRISPDVGNRRTTTTLGYNHALSKRSEAYVAYMSDKLANVGTGGNYGVGLRHRF